MIESGVAASESSGIFLRDFERSEGIVRTLDRSPRLPPAQASNLLPLTAALYEPLWRRQSLWLLSGGRTRVERELAELLRWAEGLGAGALLDVGCSSGLYARTLARAYPALEVHALDVSLPFLRRVALRSARDGLGLVAVHGDAAELPYRDRVFAALVSGGTLNELPDHRRALAEQARVLRPGGRLWHMYLTKAESTIGRSLQRSLQAAGLRFPDADEVVAAAAECGLELREQTRWPPVAIARFVRRSAAEQRQPTR